MIVGSELGRTPHYNAGNGKDHWQITSMMIMGDNIQGNRVVGGTDEALKALPIDPDTLEIVDNEKDGVLMTSAHIHEALRRLTGINDGSATQAYPITVERPLRLFDPV